MDKNIPHLHTYECKCGLTLTTKVEELFGSGHESHYNISYTKADTKCPKGHKLKVIGHSCCDDIVKCKCGKWFRCGLGSMWRYYD